MVEPKAAPVGGVNRGIAAMGLVFIAYLLSALACLHIFYTYHTSPALIWVPAGIAVAAVIWGGYRMWVPIFAAHAAAVLLYVPGAYGAALATGTGHAAQAAAILWFLRRYNFTSELFVMRNTILLVGAAFVFTIIEPVFSTGYTLLAGSPTPPLVTFSRAWGGGIFSVLVVTPLIITWLLAPGSGERVRTFHLAERVAAFLALGVLTYYIFWTMVPQSLGIIVIFILPALLIWFALRFPIRHMALALFTSSALGIAGAIIAQPTSATTPLNEQLLASQIYMGFIAAIYLVFVGVVEERRASFRELRALYREAADANAKKNEFIAVLAHELRNPLAPLVASVELLKLEPQTIPATFEIANIESHITMMRRLLDDLLDTARLTQSRFTLRKESVRFRDIVERSVATVEELRRARNLTLTVEPVDERLFVEADPVRLTQVLMNLLINAAKYTEPGGYIELTFAVNGDYLCIKVKDTGIGIDEAHLVSIFDPFQRSTLAPGRYGTGLGLGLYLTRELTRLHGGNIEAESEGPGKGSTFTVTLPIVWEPSTDTGGATKEAPGGTEILLVDDNEAFVQALNRLLTHFGHTLKTAYSGKEALEAVKDFTPQVIFLDIGMPEMDGYEVAERLRAGGVEATIVALSGYGQEEDRERTHAAGFDYHLVKPVGADELQTLLKEIEAKRA